MQTVNTTVLLKVAADWKDPCEAADQPLSDDVFSRIMLHHVRLIPGTEQNFYHHRFLRERIFGA